MPTQEAKARRVDEWTSLHDTPSEIAETVFEITHYDEKLAEQIWEEGSDEALVLTLVKTDKDALSWGGQIIERKDVQDVYPRQVSSQPAKKPGLLWAFYVISPPC